MKAQEKRLLLRKCWLYFSGFVTITSFSSIVQDIGDGIVLWVCFIGDIVVTYNSIRDQLVTWIFGWWLPIELPRFIIDTLVIYSSLIFAYRLSYYHSNPATEEELTFKKTAVNTIYVPFAWLKYFLFQHLSPNNLFDSTSAIAFEFMKHRMRGYLRYLLYISCIFICLLFLNWQMAFYFEVN